MYVPDHPDHDEDFYDDGFLRIEYDNFFVSCGDTILSLSRADFFLVAALAKRVERLVRAEVLWKDVWKTNEPINKDNVKKLVSRVRQKLRPYGIKIENVHGVGYRLISVVDQKIINSGGK